MPHFLKNPFNLFLSFVVLLNSIYSKVFIFVLYSYFWIIHIIHCFIFFHSSLSFYRIQHSCHLRHIISLFSFLPFFFSRGWYRWDSVHPILFFLCSISPSIVVPPYISIRIIKSIHHLLFIKWFVFLRISLLSIVLDWLIFYHCPHIWYWIANSMKLFSNWDFEYQNL